MDVNVFFLVKIRSQTHCFSTGTDNRPCGRYRFFHDIAQLAGTLNRTFARQGNRLNGQQLATDFGPSQTGYLTDAIFAFGHTIVETAHAQIVMQIFLSNFNRFRLGLAYCFGFGRFFLVLIQGNLHYHFTANFGNFTIQRADTGLAGVVTDNIAHRTFINHQLALFYTIALHLFRHKVLHGDIDFFVFRITGQTDNFHTVKQRSRDIQAV